MPPEQAGIVERIGSVKRQSLKDILIVSGVINLLSLALPFAMLQIYDRIIPNQSFGTAGIIVLGVAGAILGELFLRYARSWMFGKNAANFEYSVSMAMIEAFRKASPPQIFRLNPGRIVDALHSIASIRDIYAGQAAAAMIDLPFVVIFLALVAYLAGPLVLVPIVIWILVVAYIFLALRQITDINSAIVRNDSARTNVLIRVYSNLSGIKSMALERTVREQYSKVSQDQVVSQTSLSLLSGKLTEVVQMAAQSTVLLMVLVGALEVINGNLTTGGLAACSILAGRAVAPLSSIINIRTRLMTAASSRVKLEALLGLEPARFDGQTRYDERLPAGPVTLDAVFLTPLNNIGALRNVSLDIPANQLVCLNDIAGLRSPLVLKAVAGIEVAEQGSIHIAGVPLYQHDAEQFYRSVHFCPAWPHIFEGSVLDNLTLFNEGREEKAVRLARQLGLGDTIDRLPQGYQTLIGQNFSLNSGCNKLISLIRAIVQQPSILLIDSPLLSLDLSMQEKLINLFAELKKDCTVVVASPSTELQAKSDLVINLRDASREELVHG